MTELSDLLGLGQRELVAIVGGGGKSTLLFRLGNELAAAGKQVLLTTTTKMGRNQMDAVPTVCWSADTQCAVAALEKPGPVMLLTDGDDHKVTGPPPEVVDRLYAESTADYILVEADGSRGKPLKAPAAHEPVVPAATTTLVMMMGLEAIGQPLGAVAHRVDVATRFTGLSSNHSLTAADCADILLHPDGALRAAPATARVLVALTKARTTADREAAAKLGAIIEGRRPEIAVVTIPETGKPRPT